MLVMKYNAEINRSELGVYADRACMLSGGSGWVASFMVTELLMWSVHIVMLQRNSCPGYTSPVLNVGVEIVF